MSMPHSEIVEACRPILEGVPFHVTGTRRERRFVMGYQIWHALEQMNHPICAALCREAGPAEGKGGCSCDGPVKDKDGPVKRIGQALGNCADIEEPQYIDTRGITIDGVRPAGSDCGLFRLKL